MGKILAVNISKEKGKIKLPIDQIELKVNHGIVGDAHAGNWHRQVSLLADESVEKMRQASGINLDAGVFAENILTQGIDLKNLPIGSRLKVGETVLEVTQIGKKCHNDCEIKRKVGNCVMPTEGIFAIVIEEGLIRPGDRIEKID